MNPPQKRSHHLRAMGIDVYQLKNKVVAETQPGVKSLEQTTVAKDDASSDADKVWQLLRQRVATCQQCELHHGRTQTVFGVGNINANWLIIGEAPGAAEDKQGEPFVGRAGKLLNNMLTAIDLQREQVFIANVIKCRPPNNRNPQAQEIEACASYLAQQIALIQPKLILAVGRIAAQSLTQTDLPIGKMRGRQYQYADTNIPLVVTYHPAYLLRAPGEKRKVWQDIKFAKHIYQSLR